MLRYITAGESHGESILTVVEGLPYGLPINLDFINQALKRRQGGYGRSQRMQIEIDQAEIVSGVRRGYTLGSPVTVLIRNRVTDIDDQQELRVARPGHADLAGVLKLGIRDARDVSERASARETVARTAAGALANWLLLQFGIYVIGYVVEIASIACDLSVSNPSELKERRDSSIFYLVDPRLDSRVKEEVDAAERRGDTVGGVIEVMAFNVPPGLGGFAYLDQRLDGNIGCALFCIPTIKGVEFGIGFKGVRLPGSELHDEIILREDGNIGRASNNAGGIEGGMSNGEIILVRAASKPVPTLRKPLRSIDLRSAKPMPAPYERSDICAVPAVSVVSECVVGFEIAKAFLEKFGADTFEEIRTRHQRYKNELIRRGKRVQK